jgi:hypothetical protein
MVDPVLAFRERQSHPKPKSDNWTVLFRNEAGVCEIPTVLSVDENCGELPRIGFAAPVFGSTVRVRVKSYDGPDCLRGFLFCARNDAATVMYGAKLVKVEQVNVGITELVFRADCDKWGNSPTITLTLDHAKRFLSGRMPSRDNMRHDG